MVYRKFSFHPEISTTVSSLSPSSPPSSLPHNWEHSTIHILKELKIKGIDPFVDNDIERNKAISPALIKAIRGNYASSTWCLNELVEIMKGMDELGQIVMTIFYEVDPYDVKKQTRDFGKVFRKTCAGKTNEDIGKWRQALSKIATIAVGMGAHMEKMKPVLCLESNEVRMIGIWGPSRIGKSTIARLLFSEHAHQFQLSVFMENIKVPYPRPCNDECSTKLHLQTEFLSQTFNQNVTEVPHLGVVQKRLKDKKVLVILDDVDRLGQLDALAKEICWFGPGSRVIITTEDRKLLKAHGTKHIYKVDFPSNNEALQNFCMNAFCSHFRGMSKQEWKNELPRIKTSLDGETESNLNFSYDALCDKDKYLFLHIACFFNHKEMEKVEEYLVKKFPDVKQGLHVLADKSLMTINSRYMEMHNLLVQLGREIGSSSRSVIGLELKDAYDDDELYISERGFEGMSNLQSLRIYSNYFHPIKIYFPQCLNYLSRKLRLLHFDHFPMTILPTIVNPEFLIGLVMHDSKLGKLWEGIKPLRNLKWMDLRSSVNLKVLPDLSTASNLKELDCSFCSSLEELPLSIGNATNLETLNLSSCSTPVSIGNATKLEELELGNCSRLDLYLYNCSSLVKIPFSIENFFNLKKFNISGCSSLLPSSIGNAANLELLDLRGCINL
ncbi:hypothetical protein EUTSA_v100028561mg, partial [Eutrema salsugineum]